MELRKILGIIFIILGLIFIIYPMYSAAVVSLIAGICLICFGFASIVTGCTVWSIMTHVSVLDIVIGIFAVLIGFLFIFKIDALAFLSAYLFYLVAFVLIIVGFFGIFFAFDTVSRVISVLITILGFIAAFLAAFLLAEPLYVAILVGIGLILEGLELFLINPAIDPI